MYAICIIGSIYIWIVSAHVTISWDYPAERLGHGVHHTTFPTLEVFDKRKSLSGGTRSDNFLQECFGKGSITLGRYTIIIIGMVLEIGESIRTCRNFSRIYLLSTLCICIEIYHPVGHTILVPGQFDGVFLHLSLDISRLHTVWLDIKHDIINHLCREIGTRSLRSIYRHQSREFTLTCIFVKSNHHWLPFIIVIRKDSQCIKGSRIEWIRHYTYCHIAITLGRIVLHIEAQIYTLQVLYLW